MAQAEVIRITKTSESQAKVMELLEKAQGCRAGEKRRRSRSKSEEQRYTRRKRSRSPVTRGRAERSPAGRSRNERTGRRSTSMERRRSKELCRDYTKPGGCSYGSRCKYFHPKEKEVQGLPRSGSRGRRSPARNRSREDRGKRNTKEDSGRRTRSRSKGPRGRRSRSNEPRGRRSRSKELCRDITKPGGCSWGANRCKYFHPKEVAKEDCSYWLLDTCTFGDKCRGLHEPSRRGARRIQEKGSLKEPRRSQEPRAEPREEPRRSSRDEDQGFLKSLAPVLASMVSQGIAKSQEVNHASYPSSLPSYHAPLPSYPAPLPSLPSASYSRRTASPVGRQGWRGEQEQELADGTLVVMHQGQPRVVYGGAGRGAGAGQERPSFWCH